MKVTLMAGFVGTTVAIDVHAACQSACGLVASVDACKIAVADNGVCKMLLSNGETLKYGEKSTGGFRPLKVADAVAMVSAPHGNCFAMCYEDAACRESGSYCNTGGVCPNLYWNKHSNLQVPLEYSFYTESAPVSTDSAVLCDFGHSEQPVVTEDLPGYVDPCPALCALSHTPAECLLVERSQGVCHRLFWTDESETATMFMVQTPSNEIAVTVEKAFDLLKVSSCEQACEENPHCSSSFCNGDNRTCKELFFDRSAPTADQMSICFGSRCKSDTIPVMCELPGDKKGAINGNKSVKEMEATTTTTKGAAVIGAAMVICLALF